LAPQPAPVHPGNRAALASRAGAVQMDLQAAPAWRAATARPGAVGCPIPLERGPGQGQIVRRDLLGCIINDYEHQQGA
jgi:hypothetical protein